MFSSGGSGLGPARINWTTQSASDPLRQPAINLYRIAQQGGIAVPPVIPRCRPAVTRGLNHPSSRLPRRRLPLRQSAFESRPQSSIFQTFCCINVYASYYATSVARAAGNGFCAGFFDIVVFWRRIISCSSLPYFVNPCPSVVAKLCVFVTWFYFSLSDWQQAGLFRCWAHPFVPLFA